MSSCFSRCLRVPIAMPRFYEPSLWIPQKFLFANLDLHHGLLGVTLKTVETHRSNIMLKLQLHSTVELVLYAVRNEIVHVQLPAKVLRVPQNRNGRPDMAFMPLFENCRLP